MSNHDGNDIEVLPDGSWTPLEAKKDSEEPPTKVCPELSEKSRSLVLVWVLGPEACL